MPSYKHFIAGKSVIGTDGCIADIGTLEYELICCERADKIREYLGKDFATVKERYEQHRPQADHLNCPDDLIINNEEISIRDTREIAQMRLCDIEWYYATDSYASKDVRLARAKRIKRHAQRLVKYWEGGV